ncbi:MAG: hypothetical protein JSV92_00075 [archaeon]|nr:MAG: hypothetical protein JSV92_00075 [archaeon]
MKTMIPERLKKEFFIELFIFCIGIGTMALFFENNILVSIILLALCLIRLWLYHRKDDLFFFFSGALFGPVSEIILVSFGVWRYANPTFLGVPMWLPFAWGLATLMIKRFAEIFVKIEVKK